MASPSNMHLKLGLKIDTFTQTVLYPKQVNVIMAANNITRETATPT